MLCVGNSMIFRITLYKCLALAVLSITSCNNALFDSFDGAGRSKVEEVYVPPITAYIFGEAMPANLPITCNVESINCDWNNIERFATADEMVAAIFDNQYGTSNYFTKQFMMANRAYINDLQIVFVKTDSNVTSTSTFSALDSQVYTLSDPTGTEDKGTIHHPEERIRMVFTGSFTCGSVAAAGCASLNGIYGIENPHQGLIVMDSGGWTLRTMSETMAHELGHFFGLSHTFNSPATDGCETIEQGSTKYIMDYSSNATLFQACEIAHAKTLLEASPFSIGYFENVPVDDNPVLLSINSDETFDPTEQKIEVIRGDWEGKRTIGTPPDPNEPKLDLPFMP
jgi:hypothetical protein